MAFNEQGFRQAAVQQGFSPDQVESYVKQRNSEEKAKSRTGLSKWLFGERTSIPGMALEAVGNVLNVPSYAAGGVLNNLQRMGGSKYAQGQQVQPLGLIEGVKNKRAVMSELPETFGIDPNSAAGVAIGFGGELLTPDLFMGADLAKGLSFARKSKSASKGGLFARSAGKAGDRLAEQSDLFLTGGLGNPKIQSTIGNIGGKDSISLADLMRKYPELVSRDPEEAAALLNELNKNFQKVGMRSATQTYVGDILKPLQERIKKLEPIAVRRPGGEAAKELEVLKINLTQLQKRFGAGAPRKGSKSDLYTPTARALRERKIIEGDIPQGVFNRGANPGKEAGNLLAADSIREAARTADPRLRDLGQDISRMIEVEKLFKNSASRDAARNRFGLRDVAAVAGGSFFGGVPGAVAGAATRQFVDSPGGRIAISSGLQGASKVLRDPRTGRVLNAAEMGTTRLARTGVRVATQPNRDQLQKQKPQTQQQQRPQAPQPVRRSSAQQLDSQRELLNTSSNRPSRMENPYKKLRLRS